MSPGLGCLWWWSAGWAFSVTVTERLDMDELRETTAACSFFVSTCVTALAITEQVLDKSFNVWLLGTLQDWLQMNTLRILKQVRVL